MFFNMFSKVSFTWAKTHATAILLTLAPWGAAKGPKATTAIVKSTLANGMFTIKLAQRKCRFKMVKMLNL
jgi:hypothetical protein